jgi:hypothetical protein
MLGIRCPDRHALLRITSSKLRRPRRVFPSRASGFVHRLFADLDPKTRAWALERWTPHPIAFRFQPVKLASFWSQQWNTSVIWCRRAPNPGEAHQRCAAERLGAKWAELDTGH